MYTLQGSERGNRGLHGYQLEARRCSGKKMVTRELTPEESDFFVNMVAQTPNYVSTLLLLDGHFANYVEEAKLIDSNVPGEQGICGS